MLLSSEESIHIELGYPVPLLLEPSTCLNLNRLFMFGIILLRNFRCWKMWFWNDLLQLDLQTIRDMWPFTRVCAIFEDHRYLSAQIVPVLFQ